MLWTIQTVWYGCHRGQELGGRAHTQHCDESMYKMYVLTHRVNSYDPCHSHRMTDTFNEETLQLSRRWHISSDTLVSCLKLKVPIGTVFTDHWWTNFSHLLAILTYDKIIRNDGFVILISKDRKWVNSAQYLEWLVFIWGDLDRLV